MSKTLFKNLSIIVFIGLIFSNFPFLFYGMVFGSPAILLSTLCVGLIFKKELS